MKEHLEIFANLKGVNEASLDSVVTEMIDEVSSCLYLSSGLRSFVSKFILTELALYLVKFTWSLANLDVHLTKVVCIV